MNKGKNSWTVGWNSTELWKVRLNVHQESRILTGEEMALFRSGAYLNYWAVDFLFAIYKSSGECLTGDLKYSEGRKNSNRMVLNWIETFKEVDYSLLTREMIDDFIHLETLYKLTNNRMLSNSEYEQFKKMYHALQRHDYEIFHQNLKGLNGLKPYKPSRILNQNKES